MPRPDPASNDRVDASLGAPRPPLAAGTDDRCELAALREEWSKFEATPVIVGGPEEQPETGWAGIDARILLRSEQSAGRFAAHSLRLAPGAGMSAHYHDEAHCYAAVVEGELDLQIGATIKRVGPYTLGYCPPRTRIGVRNGGDSEARLILVHAPGGAERAFQAAHDEWVRSGDTNEETYERILARYGFRFDAEALENDGRTNSILEPIEFEFKGEGDLQRIRELFEARPAVPRLIPITLEEMNDKPATGTYRNEAIRGDDTAGHGMINMLSGAPGMNAPPHYQPTEDEFFFILDGSLRMTCGGATKDLAPGAMAFCPKHCTHGFINAAESGDARFFTLNSPAGHERALAAVRLMGQAGASRDEIDRMSQAGGFIFKRLPEFG